MSAAGDPSVLFSREIHQMNLVLGKFVQKTGAETVLLVDDAGHLLARQGKTSPASEDTISALVGGMLNAHKFLADMLGGMEFSTAIEREGGYLLLLPAGQEAMLAVTFDDSSSSSLMRTYALESVRRLEPIIRARRNRDRKGEQNERIEKDRFDAELDGALTDVFG